MPQQLDIADGERRQDVLPLPKLGSLSLEPLLAYT